MNFAELNKKITISGTQLESMHRYGINMACKQLGYFPHRESLSLQKECKSIRILLFLYYDLRKTL
jgi:hypothetical protein